MRNVALLFLLAVTAGCPPTIPSRETYTREPDPTKSEIVLGVGDVVGINVWEQKDLTTDATVRPDGTITMPLVGDLKAVGETPTGLKAKIKAALANFLKGPSGTEISVALKQWRSYTFTMSGEVTRNGVFNADHYVRVTEALAMAGGLTRFAKRNDIKLFRKTGDGKHKVIPLVYDALLSGEPPEMNIYVLPGDEIVVP